MNVRDKKVPVFNIVLLVAFILFLVIVTVKYAPGVTKLASEPAKFRDVIQSHGYTGIFVFISVQILQVVIAAIPGEVVQIAGGYIYGTWLGALYLVMGAIAGSVIAFYASRLLGYPLVKAFVSEEKLTRFNFLLKSQKSEVIIFVLYLLPGIPKDILTYIAGLTPVKPLNFLITSIVARLPALFVTAYIGANLEEKNYLRVIVLSSAAVIVFFLGALYKDWAIDKIHQLVHSRKPNEG